MKVTALMPDRSTAVLDVAEGSLVYDGHNFVSPLIAQFIALYSVPVDAVSLPHRDVILQLQTQTCIGAKVVEVDAAPAASTDPSVIAQPDPSGGICICGLTCTGTDLRFAVVTLEN
jgi:hypothetical protein